MPTMSNRTQGFAGPRIWNRALSAGEISRVADGSAVTRTGLVAEYLFTAGRDTAREHDAAVKGA